MSRLAEAALAQAMRRARIVTDGCAAARDALAAVEPAVAATLDAWLAGVVPPRRLRAMLAGVDAAILVEAGDELGEDAAGLAASVRDVFRFEAALAGAPLPRGAL